MPSRLKIMDIERDMKYALIVALVICAFNLSGDIIQVAAELINR